MPRGSASRRRPSAAGPRPSRSARRPRQVRRDANADLQGFAGCGLELRHRGGNGEPGPHGAFGIVLAGFGPAEIDQHPVAHVPGDETAVALDQLRDSSDDRCG